jgi:hypothetical protein
MSTEPLLLVNARYKRVLDGLTLAAGNFMMIICCVGPGLLCFSGIGLISYQLYPAMFLLNHGFSSTASMSPVRL